MTPVVQQALAEARRRLEALYGDRLARVIVYGSQARGDARPDSDVDVLVLLDGPFDTLSELKRLSLLKLTLLERFNAYVSFQPFEEHAFREASLPFMRNVRAEGIKL